MDAASRKVVPKLESAAKTLIQQRMKQAGMRWSRDGAQAMLALRARLLSDRWHETYMTFFGMHPPF